MSTGVVLGGLAAAYVAGVAGSFVSVAATTGHPPRVGKGKEVFSGAISAGYITSLKASHLPPGAKVVFRCTAVCSRKQTLHAPAGGTVRSKVFSHLPVTDGTVFTGAATKSGWIGFYQAFTVEGSTITKSTPECIPPKGAQTPLPCTRKPPAAPTNLHTTDVQQASVTLNWSAGQAKQEGAYYLYRNSKRVAETATPQYTFRRLDCGTSYKLGVAQHDALYNVSTVTPMTVVTLSCTPSGSAIRLRLSPNKPAQVTALSCTSRGNCAAGGFYSVNASHSQAFVANQKSRVWGDAADVPGLAALNVGNNARVSSISCASTGNCAAGGRYDAGSGNNQGFVVGEMSGVWGKAIPVPGLAALNVRGDAQVSSIWCASTGNCAAGGFYRDGSGHNQAFVVREKSGVWHGAVEVPGSAGLNLDGGAAVKSVSCASARNCAAGGFYRDGSAHFRAFVVSEKSGVWGSAVEVPGIAALDTGGAARVSSISCTSTGNCAAGGYYSDGSGHAQAFLVDEKSGVWGTATEVPGSAALNVGGDAQLSSISCASTGNCAAGGSYLTGSSRIHAFVVSETSGLWGGAVDVPGMTKLNVGNAQVSSISCARTGTCVAGGYYTSGAGAQAFVVSDISGAWGNAIKVPRTAALNLGGSAGVNAVSCSSTGDCAAGGTYRDGAGATRAFVTAPGASLWLAGRRPSR